MGNHATLLGTLKKIWGNCHRCNLCDTRKNIVWWKGNPKSALLFVGEAPGANEDETGIPFVGPAGKKLDEIYENVVGNNITYSSFVTNVVSCRPPFNRVPRIDEAIACKEKLYYIIKIVQPKIVVLLGTTASKMIANVSPITSWRGRILDSYLINHKREIVEFKTIPTYHPSYVIRTGNNKSIIKEMSEDICNAWRESLK